MKDKPVLGLTFIYSQVPERLSPMGRPSVTRLSPEDPLHISTQLNTTDDMYCINLDVSVKV